MAGCELCDHFSQQRLRPIGGYFENFYSSVSRISEETFFQQAVYFSYTLQVELSEYSREVDCISGRKRGHVDFVAVPEPSVTLAKLTMLTFWLGWRGARRYCDQHQLSYALPRSLSFRFHRETSRFDAE